MEKGAPVRFFRHLLLWLIVPTLLLASVAMYGIVQQAHIDGERLADLRRTRAMNMANELRDAMRGAGDSPKARRAWLAAYLTSPPSGGAEVVSSDVPPIGAFTWDVKDGLSWEMGLPETVHSRLSARHHWKDWGFSKGRSVAQRAIEELELPDGKAYVLWGRVDNAIYGFAYASPPAATEDVLWLWTVMAACTAFAASTVLLAAMFLWRAAEKSRRADEMKTRFISDVSHELKTPLTAMGVWMDMLATGRITDPARRRHALEVIVSERGRMQRMVDMLLDCTRLAQDRRRYVMEDVDVAAVAGDVVELMRGDFAVHGLSVSVRPCHAWADRDAVKGILVNLLGNAAKYAAADGSVEIAAREENGRISVTVADHGPGIPAKAIAKVFDRFYRAEGGGTASNGGFGLGLYISRRLARGMGGELTVRLRDGGGCVFELELPSAKKE